LIRWQIEWSGFVGVVGNDAIVIRLRMWYCCSLLVSLVSPRQNWICWIHESGFGFMHWMDRFT